MSKQKYCTQSIKNAMGTNIQLARLKAGLSVIDLAGMCKCHRVTIHNLESGIYAAGYTLLYKIAAACEVSPKSLLPELKDVQIDPS